MRLGDVSSFKTGGKVVKNSPYDLLQALAWSWGTLE